MAEKKAALIFRGYRIGESRIKLDVEAERIEGETDITLKNETKEIGENKFEIILEAAVVNKSGTMDIFVKMTARFDVSPKLEDEQKVALIKMNAPAIMFPYIRAYISTLTSLSGLAPVIIPAINLSSASSD
ncbi:MAG: protein-export chaperone SecB [Muribaculaceae bacterium]|nr:protein-export chaperone SecB [Muribaculaceae bacterium]